MRLPVPYTPGAVARLRAGATAEQLGWSRDFFERIRRQHGIDIKPVPPAVPADPAKQDVKPKAVAAVVPASPDEVPRFDRGTSSVQYCGALVTLGPVQAKVFEALFDLHGADPLVFHDKTVVAARAQIEAYTISHAVRGMNQKLPRIALYVETKKGRHGGYRLRIGSIPSVSALG